MLSTTHKITLMFPYRHHHISYNVWHTSQTNEIKYIVFLGTVQTGKLAEWVARSCPSDTAVVEGAPHWLANPDGSDTREYIESFTENALRNIQERFSSTKLHVIADSQAAPSAVRVFSRPPYRAQLAGLALVQPLGLNTNAFSGTDIQRIKIFQKRMVANARYQLPALASDPRLFYNYQSWAKKVGLRGAKTKAQYNSGLQHDGMDDLKKLYKNAPNIVVICGASDKLFPPHEIEAALRRNNLAIDMLRVPGVPHSPLATKYGGKLLDKAFDYLKKIPN